MKVILTYLKVNTKSLKAYIEGITNQKVLSIKNISFSEYYNVWDVEYNAFDAGTTFVDLIRLSPNEFKYYYSRVEHQNKGGY